MVTMALHVRSQIGSSRQEKMWFIVTFIGIAAGALAELIRDMLDSRPLSDEIYRLVTVIEFSITPMMPVFLSRACGIKKPAVPLGILMAVHAAVEIILANSNMVFSIDSGGAYHRGEFYFIYIFSYAVSLLYLIAVFFILSKRFRYRNQITIIASLIIILAGILPSLMDREVKTAYLGMTFMAIILYCYYDSLTQKDMADGLAAQNMRIKSMQHSTIIGVANLIESRDSNTGEHVKNTSNYVSMLVNAAKEKGVYPETIDDEFVELVVSAAPLHDIGKIAVPDHILRKPGKLTEEEFEQMKIHAAEGGRMIHQVMDGSTDEEYVQVAYDVAAYHHEKWNGKGYPMGLKGEEIPVSARIMAIADVYDALTMERVYKKAFPVEKALAIIEEDTGTHFDPVLAPIFVELIRNGNPPENSAADEEKASVR